MLLDLPDNCAPAFRCVQAQMEEVLFQIMHSRGFTDTYVRRFRMVTRFHLQRRPLVIFISGTACTGLAGFRGRKPSCIICRLHIRLIPVG
jgi:hypothetical protein